MEYMKRYKNGIKCAEVEWTELFDILRLHYGATQCIDNGIVEDSDGGGYYCELEIKGTSGRFVRMAMVELYGDVIDGGDIEIVYDGGEDLIECVIRIKCR